MTRATFWTLSIAVCMARAVILLPAETRHTPMAQTGGSTQAAVTDIPYVKANIPYADAKPILESVREDLLPPALRAKTSAEREAAWTGWVLRHDADIRARVARADEDSTVNFLFFGTSFTKQPRVKDGDIATLDPAVDPIVRGRLDDMIAGITSPGDNERLQFARRMIERKGIDPGSAGGSTQTRSSLAEVITRVVGERQRYDSIRESARRGDAPPNVSERSTLFHDRGLSADTSIFVNFGVDQALDAIRSQAILKAGDVRRIAIVGPGLDFTDKKEGYDFYPPQTIQPFAIVDSLMRLGLAGDAIHITTLDLSPTINQHLEAARQRAGAGQAYVVELPRDMTQRWKPALADYWERFGDTIAMKTDAGAAAAPPGAGQIRVKAIGVRPEFVRSTTPWDVDIVLQRIQPPNAGGLFDLIVATNILVYYDVFEQSLALANVAKMLRPGGVFLSNDLVFELPATPLTLLNFHDVVYTDAGNGDRFVWYRRQ